MSKRIIAENPVQKIKKGIYKPVQEVLYKFSDRHLDCEIEVRNSANAWWVESGKLDALVQGFKMGFNIGESCYHAGISYDQYAYFIKIHPEFSRFFEYCENSSKVIAKTTIFKNLDKIETAKWFAEHKMRDEFNRKFTVEEKRPDKKQKIKVYKAALLELQHDE